MYFKRRLAKILLPIALALSTCVVHAQSGVVTIPSGDPSVLIQIPRGQFTETFGIPLVPDTAHGLMGGADSLGLLIMVRSTGVIWERDTALSGGGHYWAPIGSGAGGSSTWGSITGLLANQADLDTALVHLQPLLPFYPVSPTVLSDSLLAYASLSFVAANSYPLHANPAGYLQTNGLPNVANSPQVVNGGGFQTLYMGLYANRPAAGQPGRMYFATDSLKWYDDNGTAWVAAIAGSNYATVNASGRGDPFIYQSGNTFYVHTLFDSTGTGVHHAVNGDGSYTLWADSIHHYFLHPAYALNDSTDAIDTLGGHFNAAYFQGIAISNATPTTGGMYEYNGASWAITDTLYGTEYLAGGLQLTGTTNTQVIGSTGNQLLKVFSQQMQSANAIYLGAGSGYGINLNVNGVLKGYMTPTGQPWWAGIPVGSVYDSLVTDSAGYQRKVPVSAFDFGGLTESDTTVIATSYVGLESIYDKTLLSHIFTIRNTDSTGLDTLAYSIGDTMYVLGVKNVWGLKIDQGLRGLYFKADTGLLATATSLYPYAKLASPAFTGSPTAPTQTSGDNSTKIATDAYVGTALASYAPLTSPAFTGTPTAPTASGGTNTTQLATTAFVTSAVAAGTVGNLQAVFTAQADRAVLTASDTLDDASFPLYLTGSLYPSVNNSLSIGRTANTWLKIFVQQMQSDGAVYLSAASGNGTNFITNGVTEATISAAGQPWYAGLGTGSTADSAVTDSAGFERKLALATILAPYAPLASPALTGSPTAPTQTAGDATTKIATDAFVNTSFAKLASPTFTGTPAVPTASGGTNTTQIASTAFVASAISGLAPLASPTFTGTPAGPTASAGTNTTQLATTAFVANSFAPLASPALTGVPTVPTAATATNNGQAASTAFVQNAIAAAGTWATGSYTPMLTDNSGGLLTSLSAGTFYYTVIDNHVFIDGIINYTTSSTGENGVLVSLPSGLTSNFTTTTDAVGNVTTGAQTSGSGESGQGHVNVYLSTKVLQASFVGSLSGTTISASAFVHAVYILK